MIIAQVQHGRNIPGVAVFKGHYAVGSFAGGHGLEYLVPCGIAHGLGVGEQRLEGDVGKRSLHPLIGGAVAPQHGSLVLLGDVHHVLDMVFIVRAQRKLLNAGCGLFQHGGLPGGIVDGQAVRPLIFGHLQNGSHPALEQRSQLRIYRVDLGTGLFQCVHGGHILFGRFLRGYLVSIP